MQRQLLVNPTSAVELSDFWVPMLSDAPSVPLADLVDDLPPVGAVGAYQWFRRSACGSVGECLYIGSGILRVRLNRERRKLLDATRLNRAGIEVAHVVTEVPGIARMVELLAIDRNRPSWQSMGFGSNQPGRGRAGQAPTEWARRYA